MALSTLEPGPTTPKGFRAGRLGIDVGSSCIKMARMDWCSGRWSITNRLLIPLDVSETGAPENSHDLRISNAVAILKRRPLSNTHACSVVLPMSVTDITSIEVPCGDATEVEQMATESLRDSSPSFDQRVTTLWRHAVTPHDLAMVSAVSIANITGEQVVNDLSEVGLKCGSLESVPFALARAAGMTSGGQTAQPIGLLDWGHESVTFVVTYQGRPEFVRSFRNCGSRLLIEAIAAGLNLSTEDARQILATTDLSKAGQGGRLSRAVAQLLAPEIQNTVHELNKTLLYLRHHLSRLVPSRMILFGGVAAVPGMPALFQSQSGVESRAWTLDARNSHDSDAAFALALATSVRESE